jgi:hypothetical protein
VQWQRRLLIAAGVISAATTPELLPLKALGRVEREVYLGYMELLSCFWLSDPGRPLMFTAGFASDWCAVKHRSAAQALNSLDAKRYIIVAEKLASAKGHLTRAWLPGQPSGRTYQPSKTCTLTGDVTGGRRSRSASRA